MISIIIPVVNEEKTIESTVKSIRSAATMPHEIIVADGGSTDKTAEIARTCADLVAIHPADKPQTISSNRNNGAKQAKGEFIAFVDAGTVLATPQFFDRALKNFADPQVVAITARLKVLPEVSTFMDKIVYAVMNFNFVVINNILKKGAAQGKFQMIRREAFEKVGGYREDLPASEDMDLFSRLSRIGRTRIDTGLLVYHTGRRAHAIGWPKLLFIWWRDGFSLFFRNKVVSKEWKH